MKKLLLSFATLLTSMAVFGQTIVFQENFDPPSLADSVTSTGTPTWAIDNTLSVSTPNSMGNQVGLSTSNFLETNTFSTVGNTFVILEFSHICKIEFFDSGTIEVSNDGGTTWTQLTCPQYLGTGTFCQSGNKFASNAYLVWDPANPGTVPTNTWWQNESFDVSTLLANTAQAKVRFKLQDGNNSGASGNYGWLIDDIKVTAAPSELNPPVVTLNAPVLLGGVSNTGPFTISADITDASGIDTAMVIYSFNGAPDDTVGMTNTMGSTFEGILPAAAIGDTFCYRVRAVDASPALNEAFAPSTGCNQFIVVPAPSQIILGTGNIQNTGTSYPAPYGNWFNGARHQMLITATEMAAAGVNGSIDFQSLAFDVTQVNGVALTDFEIKMGNYSGTALTSFVTAGMTSVFSTTSYTETLGWNTHTFQTPFQWDGVSNIIVEVCFNNFPNGFTNNAIVNQTGYGATRTIFYISDTDGSLCTNPNGFVQQSNNRPNMQFNIGSPQPKDFGVLAIENPVNGGCGLSAAESVEVLLKNNGTDDQDTIYVHYILDNGPQVTDTIYQLVAAGDTLPYTFNSTVDVSTGGQSYTLTVWTDLPGDFNFFNDSATTVIENTLTGVPLTQDIDGWALGTVFGDFWENSPSGTLWTVGTGTSPGFNTGPSGDHTPGFGGNYVYLPENFAQQTATMTSPCLDFSTSLAPKLSFWYHMWGTGIGTLTVEVRDSNNAWVPIWSLTGDQGNQWNEALVDLAPYAGQVTKVRFIGTNVSFSGETALDDIFIFEPQPNDVVLAGVFEPFPNGCGYGAADSVRVMVSNFGTLTQDTIPVGYDLDANATVWDTLYTTLNPGDTVIFTFSTTADLSLTGTTYNFDFFTGLPSDQNTVNDTLAGYSIFNPSSIIAFPHLEDFESFTAGGGNGTVPGVLSNDWERSPEPTQFGDYGWLVQVGPTGSFGTGPSGDNTPGQNGAGKYLYTEANGGSAFDEATLTSPCVDFANLSSPAVEFYIHRFGFQLPDVFIEVYSGGVWNTVDTLTGQLQTSEINPYIRHQTDLSAFAGENVKVRWRAISQGCCAGDMALDDVRFYEVVPDDAAALAILQPAGLTVGGQATTVEMQIFNYGTNTITAMDLGFLVNNGTPTIESWTGSLAPNASTTYTFTGTFNAPQGTYDLCAFTDLSGDMAPLNDTTCKTVVGLSTFVPPYATDFESGQGSWAVDGGLQQWELGTPSGFTINAANSPVNAWMIDLDGSYANNSNDYLYSPLFDLSTLYSTELRFSNRIDCDNFGDGGQVEVSTDGGQTWSVLGVLNDPLGTNWYNTNSGFPPIPAWAGNNVSWTNTTFDLSAFDASPGLIQFRFRFFSDGFFPFGDGWAIDDFEIFVPIQNSAATVDLGIGANSAFVLPDDVPVSMWIENTGVAPLTSVEANLNIDNGAFTLTEPVVIPIPLQQGDSILHTFSQLWTASPGPHTVCVYTSNPNGTADTFTQDDTLCALISVFDSTGAFPYCDDFDSGSPQWVTFNAFDYSPTTQWEVGTPSQTVLNGAYSGTNAWMTGLNSDYEDNDSSALYTPVFNVNNINCYRLDFYHRYFTDEYEDGGTVEYTQDNGLTWTTVGYAFDPMWFDSQFITGLGSINPGIPGWSGTSAGWQFATHDIKFDNVGATVIRFRFGSNFTGRNEGWAIDDVCFTEIAPCIISVVEYDRASFEFAQLEPNPARDYTRLRFEVSRAGTVDFVLVNSFGQVVTEQTFDAQVGENLIDLDLTEWPAGVYFINAQHPGGMATERLIITK